MTSISLQNINFSYPGGDDLFSKLSVTFRGDCIVGLVGDNGSGKSTLLKLITGELQPTSGRVVCDGSVAYLPQMNPHNNKSGGQSQMDAISRIFDSGADILLLDEPTNNLDSHARRRFFDLLARHHGGTVIISHDQELLRHVDMILELSHGDVTAYGGNYDFYVSVRESVRQNLNAQYTNATKRINELNRTMMVAQTTRSHHTAKQKKDKANAAAGSRIEVNALKGKSQETEARTRRIIQQKLNQQYEIQDSISQLLRVEPIKIPLPSKPFYSKELIQISQMSFGYDDELIFDKFDFTMYGTDHIHITGANGSGKSTLLKLITGELQPTSGTIQTFGRIAYLNQDLSLLRPDLSVVENISDISGLLIHDAHAIAANFGFRGDMGRRRVSTLSGGQLLRATLAAILGTSNQPDLIILDEPTNNLDLSSKSILQDALRQYSGAILLVSHDTGFIDALGIENKIAL